MYVTIIVILYIYFFTKSGESITNLPNIPKQRILPRRLNLNSQAAAKAAKPKASAKAKAATSTAGGPKGFSEESPWGENDGCNK